MSTYTDLHNKVKENIAVDYHNRITPQKVRLFNEENEYWGTFKGHVAAEDIQIKGGQISGATLFDTKLCGNIDIPGIGILSTYTDKIEQISAVADNAAEGLVDETAARIAADQALEERINGISFGGISVDLEQAISKVSVELSTKFDNKLDSFQSSLCAVVNAHVDSAIAKSDSYANELCTKIDVQASAANEAIATETSRRIADCQHISSQVDNLCSDLGAEAISRKETDFMLSNQLLTAEKAEAEHFIELSASLSAYEEYTAEAFAEADAKMLSTVAHDKHYAIYGEAEGLFNSYPYKLKDYAMNIVYTSINTAIVVDQKHGNAIVGTVSENADYTQLKFYDLENDPELRKLINPKASYTFLATGPQYAIDGKSRISYDKATKRVVVSSTATGKYFKVTYDGDQIGTIEGPEVAADGSLISGSMTVSTSGALSAFNGFVHQTFSRSQPDMAVGAERIEFVGPNYTTFNFRKYVSDVWYCPISAYNKTLGRDQEVARLLSGSIKFQEGNVKEIGVSCQGHIVSLHSESNFATTFADGLRLSCDVIDAEEGIFALDYVSAYYKYKLYEESDKQFVGKVLGYAIPGKANTALSAKDFNEVSVVLNVPDHTTASGTYKLDKVTGVAYDIWRGTTEIAGGSITVEYNTQTVKFYGTKYGIKFKGTYAAKVNDLSPEVYDEATTSRNLWTSSQVYWSRSEDYKKIMADAGQYTANAVGPYDPSAEAVELAIESQGANVLKLQVPDKPFPDASRELMLVFNVTAEQPIVSVDLLSSNGMQVDFFNNRQRSLILSSGVWTTYALNEVRHNKFLVRDVNESDHLKQFNVLSAKVDSELQRSGEADLQHDIDINAISVQLHEHEHDSAAQFANISSAVESRFVHISGDSGIGELKLDSGITAYNGDFKQLDVRDAKISSLSVSFSNVIDFGYSGSLSTLGELVEPCLLSVCSRINEIVSYAGLGLPLVSINAELVSNIVARTNNICNIAGIGALPADPTFGDIVDKLNESLSHFAFQETGLTLESRLHVLATSIDNATSMIQLQQADIAKLSARANACEATDAAISSRLSSVDPFNSKTFMKHQLTKGDDIAVDNLVLTDEDSSDGHSYVRYRMTFESGTIVLKRI